MKIAVLEGATTKFGELWHRSPRSLASEAVFEAIERAGIKHSEIEALFVGNMLAGILGGQENIGALFADELGFCIPVVRVEGACASGGLAVHSAVLSILAGVYQTVLVLGIEKMTDYKPEEVAMALMGGGSDEEREAGLTFPGLYALLAQAHMEKYSTTEEQMAAVAVKNHYHASQNEKAQFQGQISIEQVLKSPKVADPLKVLDCSPISDGAAALVLSQNPKHLTHKPVYLVASAVATDTLALSDRKSLTSLKATQIAAKQAYHLAGVEPKDIDVAEVHDCFTIAEIIAMEDLGFFEKGKAGLAIFRGQTRIGSQGLIVNPSGGLKACGHPVGATGVKQIVEIFEQLKGRAGKRQVKGARVGLAHNVGGSGGLAVVHILTRG